MSWGSLRDTHAFPGSGTSHHSSVTLRQKHPMTITGTSLGDGTPHRACAAKDHRHVRSTPPRSAGGGAGEGQYLRGDWSEWLQRHRWHLDGRRLCRGHLGSRSQVRRQVSGHRLERAHGRRGQDLWQGRWLGQGRLEREGRLLHSVPLRCPQVLRSDRDAHTHACRPTHTYTPSREPRTCRSGRMLCVNEAPPSAMGLEFHKHETPPPMSTLGPGQPW